MKNLFVWLFISALILSAAAATNMIPSDVLKGSWKVFKKKTELRIVNKELSAKGSYCCTFSDGTKCYSTDCSFCGCSGSKVADLIKKGKDGVHVQLSAKEGVSVRELSREALQASDGGSYCCTFSDGTKCAATDCSF
ncbi:MAG: hypothetical protein AAFR59_19680, partial [Bacteroidota bacterium]